MYLHDDVCTEEREGVKHIGKQLVCLLYIFNLTVREPQDTRCDYPADHDGKCSGIPDVSFGSTTP